MEELLDQYYREITAAFQDEEYLVRDNGAVFRKCREGKRKRKLDEAWTFGNENTTNPYLHIAGVRVHRIVATAFHGDPPNPQYVVDHIDTNCRNNRPENLRWLTRLENSLKNPVTRKKIEYFCGSIETFLENPSVLNEMQLEPRFEWMKTVTREEAKNCMDRMSYWANIPSKKYEKSKTTARSSSHGSRIYRPLSKGEVGLPREPGLDLSLTPWCAQYMWRASAYFPSCPDQITLHRVDGYFKNLLAGEVLAYSDQEEFCPKLFVKKAKHFSQIGSILVLAESADEEYVIVGIELHEKSQHFIHFNLGSYSKLNEAEAAFDAKDRLTDFWSEAYSAAY
jgi:hypothetical protein